MIKEKGRIVIRVNIAAKEAEIKEVRQIFK